MIFIIVKFSPPQNFKIQTINKKIQNKQKENVVCRLGRNKYKEYIKVKSFQSYHHHLYNLLITLY